MATSRLVCTAAAKSGLCLVCRCDMLHEFKPVWICATDRSDNDFHMSHEAICCSNLSRRRVAAICRIVCLCLKLLIISHQWNIAVNLSNCFSTLLSCALINSIRQCDQNCYNKLLSKSAKTRPMINLTSETISDSAECSTVCQNVLSHLLPECNLLVQGPKITITVCQDGFKFYCGVLGWILFILNSLIRWTGKRDNFIFSTPTFVTWYFCFSCNVCNMTPLFSQEHTKEDMLVFSC